ncbi:MAG: carbon-nitrogen hydrolase family protein, partial [Planctomycetales bacterium]
MKFRAAVCQFPVTGNVNRNCRWIRKQMKQAARKGAAIALFPECALGGYAGFHLDSFREYDWDAAERVAERVMKQARELKMWTAFGANHRLTGKHKPHNSLYLVSDEGRIVDRYDKRFCLGDEGEFDLRH